MLHAIDIDEVKEQAAIIKFLSVQLEEACVRARRIIGPMNKLSTEDLAAYIDMGIPYLSFDLTQEARRRALANANQENKGE